MINNKYKKLTIPKSPAYGFQNIEIKYINNSNHIIFSMHWIKRLKEQQHHLEICRKDMALWEKKRKDDLEPHQTAEGKKYKIFHDKQSSQWHQRSTTIQEIHDMLHCWQKLRNYTKLVIEIQCQQVKNRTMTNWTMV